MVRNIASLTFLLMIVMCFNAAMEVHKKRKISQKPGVLKYFCELLRISRLEGVHCNR